MIKLLLLSVFGLTLICRESSAQSREMEGKLETIPKLKTYFKSVRSIEDEDELEKQNPKGPWESNEYNQAPKFYLAAQSSGKMDIENDSDFLSSLANDLQRHHQMLNSLNDRFGTEKRFIEFKRRDFKPTKK